MKHENNIVSGMIILTYVKFANKAMTIIIMLYKKLVELNHHDISICHIATYHGYYVTATIVMIISNKKRSQGISQLNWNKHTHLTERQKVAVRFADAYLLHPAELSPELRADLQRYFTTAEILELVLRLTHNTINRVNGAMNTHREVDGIEITRDF